MASSTKIAGTGTDVASGLGVTVWSNPSRITANDGSNATASVSTGSHYLRASNFGFTIPSTATITGIVVSIKRYSGATNRIYDQALKLVNAAGSVVGNDKASSSFWPTTSTVATYGTSNDLWGLTLTYTDINDTDFGCVLAIKSSSSTNTGNVDYIEITVYYSDITNIAAVISQSATVTPILHRMIGCVASLAQTASLTSALITYVNFETAITQVSSLVTNIKTVKNFVTSIVQNATLIAGSKVEVRIASAVEQLQTITAKLRVPALLSVAIQQLATFVPKGSSSWTSVDPPNNSWDENADGSDTWVDISDSTNWTEL